MSKGFHRAELGVEAGSFASVSSPRHRGDRVDELETRFDKSFKFYGVFVASVNPWEIGQGSLKADHEGGVQR